MIIVDTNVSSELMRPSPSELVRDWVQSRPGRDLYTSAITVAEIRRCIEKLPQGRRNNSLSSAANEIFETFAQQILTFDAVAAEQYALIVSHRDGLGLPIDGFDAQIAAICRVHGATLATRNVSDFRQTGIELINPWKGED